MWNSCPLPPAYALKLCCSKGVLGTSTGTSTGNVKNAASENKSESVFLTRSLSDMLSLNCPESTPPKRQVLFCFCVLYIVFLKLQGASAPPENLIKMRPCSRRVSCLLRRKENLLTCPGHSLSTSEEPSARSLSCILQIPELNTQKKKKKLSVKSLEKEKGPNLQIRISESARVEFRHLYL